MKTLSLSCLVASLFIIGCAPQTPSPMEGGWKLVHATWVQNDTLVGQMPGNWTGSGMKVWAKGSFAFVGKYKSDTTSFNSYGGGKYTLDGNRYDEMIQYHVATGMIGDTVKMLLEVKNDTLVQTWPVGANGQIDKKNYEEEKYIRLN